MSKKKFTQFTFIAVLIAAILACDISATPTFIPPTATPTLTPTLTTTPAPTLTPTSTSTPTPTLTPTLGMVTIRGKMIWNSTGEPVGGAGVILCRCAEDSCTIVSSLKTTTTMDGSFEIVEVPLNSEYVLLYNPNGEPSFGWQTLNGHLIDWGDKTSKTLGDLVQGHGITFTPYFGDGDLAMANDSTLLQMFGDFGFWVMMQEGSIRSNKYGLYMDFYNNQPIIVDDNLGEVAEATFRVWKWIGATTIVR